MLLETHRERAMESNERYYRRRADEEAFAARRAVTPESRARHRELADSFRRQLSEVALDLVSVAEYS